MTRWSTEQVLALAPARLSAARPLAVPALWDTTGCDERGVWGRFRGSRGEPYQTMVDHTPGEAHRDIGARCTCASRVTPCKHAVALLLVWAADRVAESSRPNAVEAWFRQRDAAAPAPVARPAADTAAAGTVPGEPSPPAARPTAERGDGRNDDRVKRVTAGLRELERWIDDRVRVGLGDPSIARYATWDDLATRLVDAQATGLANRVRRLAGHVGARPGWHEHVLSELGVLHLLARAGQRLRDLDDPWADGVSAAVGFTVKQADVRAGVPDTSRWSVRGRSDVVEDRIVVRRLWVRSVEGGGPTDGWAVLLSFAAYGQSLDDTLHVGDEFRADLHRYPGTVPLRALLGARHDAHDDMHGPVAEGPVAEGPVAEGPVAEGPHRLVSPSIAAALESVGGMLALEPWLERVPLTVAAAPAQLGPAWALVDHSGSLPLAPIGADGGADVAVLLAASGGRPVVVTGEWTALGLVPLTVHLEDRALDVGPRGGFR